MTSASSGAISLREQLLGSAPDPDFELQLLPGWTKWVPDERQYGEMGAAMRRRLVQAGRPEAMGAVVELLQSTFRDLRAQNVIAVFSATESRDETIWLPGSLVATVRRDRPDMPLQQMVARLIREHGGQPLFGDKRFVRYVRDSVRAVEGGTIRLRTINYLTPIPTAGGTRALALTASYGVPETLPVDDPQARAYELAFDAMVSTLRWVKPAADRTSPSTADDGGRSGS